MDEDKKQAVEQAAGSAVESIGIFAQTNAVLKDIADSADAASKTSAKVAALFSEFLNINLTPSLEPIREPVADATQRSPIFTSTENPFDIAKLGLILPFLFDKTSREYIASFVKGLIGVETLDKITTVLKVLGVTLATVFAVKLFKRVSDTISTFVRLSQLVGVLFGFTRESNELEVEDARMTEKDKWEKRKKKYEKNTSELRKRRLDKLNKVRKIRKVLKALGTVGKFTGIGFIVGAAADAFVDSIFDYFTNDETKAIDPAFPDTEDDKDQEFPLIEEPKESFALNILKKFISNLTLGIVSEEMLDRAFNRVRNFLSGGEVDVEKEEARWNATNEFAGVMDEPTPGPTPTPKPVARPPITSGLTSEQAIAARNSAARTDPRINILPIATTPDTGVSLNSSSASVIGAKRDLTSSNIVVNNIDNSVIVASDSPQPKDYGTLSFSTSVGQ